MKSQICHLMYISIGMTSPSWWQVLQETEDRNSVEWNSSEINSITLVIGLTRERAQQEEKERQESPTGFNSVKSGSVFR